MANRVAEDIRFHIVVSLGAARSLTADQPLLETRILDSTNILDLAQFMEDTYGIRVGDDDFHPDNFGSIEKLVAFVERKRGSSP